MIWLICLVLLVCIMGILIFTLIFYTFDIYWYSNDSLWKFDYSNETNITWYDEDVMTSTIDYNDEY